MILKGGNLEEIEVEYKKLSDRKIFSDERQKLVERLEKLYFNLLEKSKETSVQKISQQDGHVILKQGMINHRCNNSLELLRNISKYGIIASEWFGVIESEREGVFCSFVDRIHDESDPNSRAAVINKQRLKSLSDDIILFFDENNPVMQKLLHLDYFEYERLKVERPESLSAIYTADEMEIFNEIIEPFSPNGKDFHLENKLPYCDWSAIPAGIPSALVNGICTKRNEYSKEYIEELSKLFPNATIFNGDLNVIYTPIKESLLQSKEPDESVLESDFER